MKVPVLVARQDGMKDPRTQMGDAIALLEAKTAAMAAYCQRIRRQPVQPVLFVVAQTIDEATVIRDMLAGPDLLGAHERVLLVTSEEPDETLRLLDKLEEPDSPVRAVVSVSMLKEGWDVKSIYVIAAVRAMESQLLTEQILGRGLRLPFGARTGVPMLDTVEVLSHHSFTGLLRQAKVLLEQTLGQRASEASLVADPVPGQRRPGAPVPASAIAPALPAEGVRQELVVELPGPAAEEDPDQMALFGDGSGGVVLDGAVTHMGMGFATVTARVAAAEMTTRTLTRTLLPRSPGGVRVPLFLPRVTTRWERDPFSLTQLNAVDVEALGRRFADDNGATLTRKALDATRTASGAVEVVITDMTDPVLASQTALPFASIEQDLAGRLLRTNGVAATASEANAALAVARAFLRGAGVTEETPWRPEHGRLATARLVEWIAAQQAARPARQVVEVSQVRWPDPAERVEALPPFDRQMIASSREFTRGYPYGGWVRSVYEVSSFDAYSTEFRLAALFETTPGVRAWTRVTATVPLRIPYSQGAVQREYEPDFIVVNDHGTHWIVEGKADAEVHDPVVRAKAEAAKAWVSAVNASPTVAQRWGYLLASESVIASSSSWDALK
ncbi:MAG: hypothetical protein M3P96_05950, partial [Actinomycetota bacterium]|nr:hypothetical protein [Actinomycetota bacterium]